MPIREYQVKEVFKGCDYCSKPFEHLERAGEEPLKRCPYCGSEVVRLISAPCIGASVSGFDSRAKSAGFHKLKRLGRGEYEKIY